jgi:hypothetical protein
MLAQELCGYARKIFEFVCSWKTARHIGEPQPKSTSWLVLKDTEIIAGCHDLRLSSELPASDPVDAPDDTGRQILLGMGERALRAITTPSSTPTERSLFLWVAQW